MRDELRELALRLPAPADSWHPYVALIAEVRADLLDGLDRLSEERLADLLEGEAPAPRPDSALAALPVPEGQHPYLDEIVPILELAARVQGASLDV